MESVARLTLARKSLIAVAVLVCWFPAIPTAAAQQGQDAVYTSGGQVTNSSAFIDASMFASKVTNPDLCSVLNYVLVHVVQTTYPAGAVIDARGVPGIAPAVSMTCSASPWAGITNPPSSTILLPATSGAGGPGVANR
jgi:hypothetical protein